MKKRAKVFLKQEKRIISAAYRAGLLIGELALDNLSWEIEYRQVAPELVYWYRSGYECVEYDYSGVVASIHDDMWLDGMYEEQTEGNPYPDFKSTYKWMTRDQLIKHLESLPRKVNDSKINKVLKITWSEL